MANRKLRRVSLYDALWHMRKGSARRLAIVEALAIESITKSSSSAYRSTIPVNCKWQLSSQDPDLQFLLKKGILRAIRTGGQRNTGGYPLGWKNSSKRQTQLVLTKSSGTAFLSSISAERIHPNQLVIMRDDCYVIYMPDLLEVYGQNVTGLHLTSTDEVYLLNGDHRKAYRKIAQEGASAVELFEYFLSNLEAINRQSAIPKNHCSRLREPS